MIGVAVAVAVLAALLFVALRRRTQPPPVTFTITADTSKFVESMRAAAAAFDRFAVSGRVASVRMALGAQQWVASEHRPVEVEPGVAVCRFDRKPYPCDAHTRAGEEIARLRKELLVVAR